MIGPDGFPDIAHGQSTIHPGEPASAGTWLGYLLQQAWAVQGSASYSAQEQGQALAFAYGFLMHAAGGTWAHTLMNDYSESSPSRRPPGSRCTTGLWRPTSAAPRPASTR